MPAPDSAETSDSKASLLAVYATQFSSYSSLLWQVPALGLTAQSFLLTIALTHGNSKGASIMASGLGMLIAVASVFLMHDQRGFATTHAWFVRQLSRQLTLVGILEGLEDPDAEPQLEVGRAGTDEPQRVLLGTRTRRDLTRTRRNLTKFMRKMLKLPVKEKDPVKGKDTGEVAIDAVSVWQVPHLIYHVWRGCMLAFMAADVVIIISAVFGFSWFG